jgi:hypothetical protein
MATADDLRGMVRGDDPRTSHDAARRVAWNGRLSQTQARVLAAIAGAGAHGLTDAELAALPAFADLRESTARKRRVELYQAGYVVPSGALRDHQTVWVATNRRPNDTLHTVATGDLHTR